MDNPAPQTKQKQRPQVQRLARQVGTGYQDDPRHDPFVLHPLACLFGDRVSYILGWPPTLYTVVGESELPILLPPPPSAGIASVHLHAWLVPVVLWVSLFIKGHGRR